MARARSAWLRVGRRTTYFQHGYAICCTRPARRTNKSLIYQELTFGLLGALSWIAPVVWRMSPRTGTSLYESVLGPKFSIYSILNPA